MSTKNIALSTAVYEKLARFKRHSESFSKAVDRLLSEAESRHTGIDILKHLLANPPLSPQDAETLLAAVEEIRQAEKWPQHDLR